MKISATYKGLITGSLMILVSLLLFYILGLPVNGYNQLYVSGIYVTGILWSLISLKLSAPGAIPFKVYFSEGFKAFIVVTLLMVVYTFIFYKLNPQILENVLVANNKLVTADANHTPAEIEENNRRLRNIFMPMTIATRTIIYLFLGAVVSLLGAFSLSQATVQRAH